MKIDDAVKLIWILFQQIVNVDAIVFVPVDALFVCLDSALTRSSCLKLGKPRIPGPSVSTGKNLVSYNTKLLNSYSVVRSEYGVLMFHISTRSWVTVT